MIRTILLGCCAAALVAQAPEPGKAPAKATGKRATTAKSAASRTPAASNRAAAGDVQIVVKPAANLKAGDEMPVEVTLKSGGKPVTGAQVELVLTMIDMDHGETKSEAKEVAPGVYKGTANFMMAGNWNLEARVVSGERKSARKIKVAVK